ncbi:c6 zinc finger protein [Rutstroemia sp. NJR-2017a WRK4]|nr:c6 zinc finger protein [Rutstroemia sp. NJR-2017a WRK4]
MKRSCTGYRDEVDLMFCHSNVKSIERSRNSRAKHRISLSPKTDPNLPHGGPDLWPEKERHVLFTGLGRALLPSKEDLALCFFYKTTMETLVGSYRSQYLHRQLPIIFSQSEPDSALKLASQAISYVVWARAWPDDINAAQVAMRCYSQSLSALNAAIGDRIKAKSDETLYAILLLSGYETMIFSSGTPAAWGTHVGGVTALLKHRGSENFRTPFSCNMFLFIRRNAIQSHLQTSTPVDPIFDSFAEILSPYEYMEDRLISKSIRIPELLARANSLLSQTSCAVDVSKAFELIRAAENLDRELANWADQIPVNGAYTSLRYSRDPRPSSSTFVPDQIHRYPDFYTARVWNLYRVYRLIIQSILFRVSSCVHLDGIDDFHDRIGSINRAMVADVCASVPFLLGYDCSELKRSPNHLQDRDSL